MRWLTVVGLVTVALVGNQPTSGGDPTPAKQFQFNVRVLEGDPLGNEAAGTLKVLANTRLATLEHRPFTFISGGESAVDGDDGMELIPFGRIVEGKARVVQGGKVRLDITLSHTTAAQRIGNRVEFRTDSTRTIATVSPGEVVKLRWGKGSADEQAWVELSVAVVGP